MKQLDDYRRFLMAVATNQVPRLKQLVAQGLKDGVSVGTLVETIQRAVDDTYRARQYDSDDMDIALMVYRLGGRKLVYAMNHYISVPSLATLRRSKIFTRIMPSLALPTKDDIRHNIQECFLRRTASTTPARPFSGVSVMWDEVNQENSACYFPHADMVGGLCREHAHSCGVDLQLKTYEDAELIGDALRKSELHYGKEASVIAIGTFCGTLRGAFPVMLSPTCKAETPDQSATYLQMVLDVWCEQAAAIFGPIWSFASDGDAGRRALCYKMFMKHVLDPMSPLGKKLARLQGLNLFVGDNDITADFDFKHLIKRELETLV